MADGDGGSEQDDVSFLRTEDMVCLSCTATGERVCLAAEGFGNRHCFLENIADKNIPPDLSQCVFVIEQALSVRALQELVTAAGSEEEGENLGKGTGSGHRTLLYGNAILLRHQNSDMHKKLSAPKNVSWKNNRRGGCRDLNPVFLRARIVE
ncbi:hypothetical protein M8J75_014541 [Diaphorina citri]|nr:hypothetical protein M8J75_014541 [Diaphorina citri]